jgi:hypothetical protein
MHVRDLQPLRLRALVLSGELTHLGGESVLPSRCFTTKNAEGAELLILLS